MGLVLFGELACHFIEVLYEKTSEKDHEKDHERDHMTVLGQIFSRLKFDNHVIAVYGEIGNLCFGDGL